ncbi:MAG TPA: hypothetical protein VLR46_13160 [Candidatus Dormibacteraeota bacterium]|nr:hypothetical protein [Candidatus Dormibacteraeota bacterium]
MQQPVQPAPPAIAPYHPPPPYPPPRPAGTQAVDSRAVVALVIALVGLVLGLPLGIPGLVCGPIAYFMGKSSANRIQASNGALGGRSLALTAWVFGIVATAVGALVTLIWLVVFLVMVSSPPA